jgi:sensor c-di-GMP phosphodiesterase-like protein
VAGSLSPLALPATLHLFHDLPAATHHITSHHITQHHTTQHHITSHQTPSHTITHHQHQHLHPHLHQPCVYKSRQAVALILEITDMELTHRSCVACAQALFYSPLQISAHHNTIKECHLLTNNQSACSPLLSPRDTAHSQSARRLHRCPPWQLQSLQHSPNPCHSSHWLR